MSDITKCPGDNCPMSNNCFRFLAKGTEYQSYFTIPPIDENGECPDHWPVNTNDYTKQTEPRT